MELSPENKLYIDSLPYRELLRRVRFAPIGDPWFQDETGEYWLEHMAELQNAPGGNEHHVRCSKSIGW